MLKTVESIVKENLLGCHVVAVENDGKDTVLCIETLILPVELLFVSDFLGRKSAARARAACAAANARSAGRATTSVAAAEAGVVNDAVGERGESTGKGMPIARVLEDLLLHLVDRECMTVINVVDKLFVRLLVEGSFREMEPHKGDKGVNVGDRGGM